MGSRTGSLVGAMVAVVCLLTGGAEAGPWLVDWRYLPVTPHEQHDLDDAIRGIEAQKDNRKLLATRRAARKASVFTDRNVYRGGDGVGQVVADAVSYVAWGDAKAMKLTLEDGQGKALDAIEVPLTGEKAMPRVVVLLPTDRLTPGLYKVTAEVQSGDDATWGGASSWTFERSVKDGPLGEIPREGVPLVVGSMAGDGEMAWPISTGIPLPRGAVSDVSKLVLLEDGKPVPAQWTVRSRWSPAEDSAARWVGLDFVAKYRNGKPREYRMALATTPVASTDDLKVTQHDDRIEVNTGPLHFEVRRKGFDGIHAAWLGGKQIVGGGDKKPGLYIVDDAGRRHSAALDSEAQVTVEEQGPVRVVISAKGWYIAAEADAPRLCRFTTHLTAYAGVPAVFVAQRTIIAYDTRTAKLADVAFAVPLIGAERYATSIDGKAQCDDLPAKGETAWLHQYRNDRVRLMRGEGATVIAEGARADGWMSISSADATALVTLRDVWQKFPKEMEAGRDALTLHFWPRHGMSTFTEEEELDRRHIYQARFAHQGKLLDLQLPQKYYDKLTEWNSAAKWDPENTAPIGYHSTAEGVAIGNDFALWLMPTAPATDPSTASLTAQRFQTPPHAITSPQWNVAAGVEAPMTARDDHRWPNAERSLNHDFPTGMLNVIDYTGSYGMWIYANTFNGWREDVPDLHRVWQNSHYQHVGEAWKLYFRSGSPELLRWARAQTDLYTNIATTHHAIPALNVPGRKIAAMYHTKGFLPWGAHQKGEYANNASLGTWGHWVDPDAHLWRYLLEGDLFSRDVYQAWTRTITQGTYPTRSASREAINSVAILFNAYAMNWDPQYVPLYRSGLEVTLATPLEDYKTAVASFPVWHKRWADRYYMLTRDERVVKSIASYVLAGFPHWTPAAFAYRHTGDMKLLEPTLPGMYATSLAIYRHEGDPLDGFGDYAGARRAENLLQLPELMEALNRAGMEERTLPQPRGYYPPGDVYVLNPDGRDFSIKLEMPAMSDNSDHLITVTAPSGKVVRTILVGRKEVMRFTPDDTTVSFDRTRFVGKAIQQVLVPAGGEKGLFKATLKGGKCHLLAPMTDLEHEAASVTKGKAVPLDTLITGVIAAPSAGEAQIRIAAMGNGVKPNLRPDAVYVRIGEPGSAVMETTLLHIASQKESSVTLPPGKGFRVFPIVVLGETTMTWTGDAERALLAPRAEDARAILEAMGK